MRPAGTPAGPLLADSHDAVRRRVRTLFWRVGVRALSVLRALSRTPGPGRRYALLGLAEVVGWNGLDATDRALVRRLIRSHRGRT